MIAHPETIKPGKTPLHPDEWKPILTIAGIFFTLCTLLVLHRHFTFYSSYDQGIFNQVLWNGTHGKFFQSTLSSQLSTNVIHAGEVPDVSYHRLGQHFTPALLLWLPFYALFPHATTLAILLVILLAAAGIVLYLLAREYLEPLPARWITYSYYGANAVIGPTLSNFHDNSQLPLFIFILLLAMEKRCWWLFALMCPLILMIREDSGIALFGVGMYMLLSRRFPQMGILVCVLSLGYMLVLTNLVMPLFSEDISKRFMLEQFGQYTDGSEATTLEIIWEILNDPWQLIVQLVTPVGRTVKYLVGQWLPFAFVPVVAPGAWIIAGFPLLKLLLGQAMSLLSINVRHALSIVPGLCYGAILWWSGEGFYHFIHPQSVRESRKITPFFRRFWITCIHISLFFTLTANPNRTLYFLVPDSVQPWVYVSPAEQWQRTAEMRQLLRQIPADASVSGTTYLIPYLSSRRAVIRLPALAFRNDQKEVETVDYVVADLWRLVRYQPAFDEDWHHLKMNAELIHHIVVTGQYGMTEFVNGVVLLQRGVSSSPEKWQQWQDYVQSLQPILNQVRD